MEPPFAMPRCSTTLSRQLMPIESVRNDRQCTQQWIAGAGSYASAELVLSLTCIDLFRVLAPHLISFCFFPFVRFCALSTRFIHHF
ncbi:hypothetical protein NXS19_003790 [Fusarium pseudograminearum]|nr:hypothetical protein NXS19_003790 [Fusarium pseudograminearum]